MDPRSFNTSSPTTEDGSNGPNRSSNASSVSFPPPSPLTVTVNIRRGRVFLLMIIFQGLILGLTFIFMHGMELKRFKAEMRDQDEREQLLDTFNAYSGSVATAFGKPIEIFVAVMAQLLILGCFPSHFTSTQFSWKTAAAVLAVSAMVTFGISNGFNAFNVQLRPQPIQSTIVSSDLFVSYTLNQNTMDSTTNVTHTLSEMRSRNLLTNTVLRNVVLPRQVLTPDLCTFEMTRLKSIRAKSIPLPTVDYGFTQREWQGRLLQQALEPKNLRFVVGSKDKTVNKGLDQKPWPMNATLAFELVRYMATIAPHYVPWGGLESLAVNASRLEDNASEQEIRTWYADVLVRQVARIFNNSINTSRSDVIVELSHVDISPSIGFDAVTFEAELDPSFLATATSSDKKTRFTDVTQAQDPSVSKPNCGPWPALCLVDKPTFMPADINSTYDTDPVQQVLAFGSCMANGTEALVVNAAKTGFDCKVQAPWSMMVLAVGKRLVADALEQNQSSRASKSQWPNARITNLRKIYTVTMGRLSWQDEDLSATFNATCSGDWPEPSRCMGLQVPLEKESLRTDKVMEEITARQQRLIVSRAFLPVWSLPPSPYLNLFVPRGVPLVTVREAPDKHILTGDVLLPHNIRNISWNPQIVADQACDADVESVLFTKLSNHMYIEHGFQTAYTTATFYLLQNAVVKDVLPATKETGKKTVLNFYGNTQDIVVHGSTPKQSAMFSLLGCVALTIGLVVAAFFSPREKEALESITAPQAIARVMLDSALFPPFLLRRHVGDQATENGVHDLNDFTIAELKIKATDTDDQSQNDTKASGATVV